LWQETYKAHINGRKWKVCLVYFISICIFSWLIQFFFLALYDHPVCYADTPPFHFVAGGEMFPLSPFPKNAKHSVVPCPKNTKQSVVPGNEHPIRTSLRSSVHPSFPLRGRRGNIPLSFCPPCPKNAKHSVVPFVSRLPYPCPSGKGIQCVMSEKNRLLLPSPAQKWRPCFWPFSLSIG
jgi:hypothetical protein